MQLQIRRPSLAQVLVAWLVSIHALWAVEPDEPPPHAFPAYSNAYTENALPPSVEPGAVLYVDVGGSDENPGTEDRPLRSLEAARNAIRELKVASDFPKGGVHVVLLAGYYPRSESFHLSEKDSGTVDSPVVYRGIGADQVILSGGVPLDTNRFEVVQSRELLSRLPAVARGFVMSIDLSGADSAECFPGEGKYGQVQKR